MFLGALCAGACACHHHAPCQAQKPALGGHPGGALNNGGTNMERVSGMGVNGGSVRPESQQGGEGA